MTGYGNYLFDHKKTKQKNFYKNETFKICYFIAKEKSVHWYSVQNYGLNSHIVGFGGF